MSEEPQSIQSQMADDGVKEGTLVELVLNEDATLYNGGTVPAYMKKRKHEDKEPRVVAAGYFLGVDEHYGKFVALGPVWAPEEKKFPGRGFVGGVHYYWNVIESYRKLSE